MSEAECTDPDIKELKDKCHSLELKMTRVKLELLKELDNHKNNKTLNANVKGDVRNLNNKTFELKIIEGK